MADSVSRLGKYEILGELGRGGFAIVYRARDTELQRVIALKVLAPHLTWDANIVARFKQEARAAAQLQHPNIVTIYEIDDVDGQFFLTMELANAGTLREHMQAQGPLAVADTVNLLMPIADALDEAHEQGLVHRDVKPANILLDRPRSGKLRPLLSDFGLVKALSQHTELTRTGTIVGTVEYMAPEQLDIDRADEVGPGTDIYALGIVAYHMLTGQAPFSGTSAQVMYAHLHKQPPAPSDVRDDLPPAVSGAILTALAKQPEERYPSVSDFVKALAAGTQAEPVAKPPPKPRPTFRSPTAANTILQPKTAKPVPAATPPVDKVEQKGIPGKSTIGRIANAAHVPTKPLIPANRRIGFILSFLLASVIGTAFGWALGMWIGGPLTDWRWQLPLTGLVFGLMIGWRQSPKLKNIVGSELFWIAATGIGLMLATILVGEVEFGDQPSRYFLALLLTLGLLQSLTLWRRLHPLWAIGWAPFVAAVLMIGLALAWRTLSETDGGSLMDKWANSATQPLIDAINNSPLSWDTTVFIFEFIGWMVRGAILGAVVGAGQAIYLAVSKARSN